MLRAAVEGIKARGGADLGDKTLLDALVPATDAIEERREGGIDRRRTRCRGGGRQRRSAAEATRPMLAKRGRAAYTGERSVGTLDAGAVAVAVLIEALADQWQTHQPQPDRPERQPRMKKFVNDPKQFVPEMLHGIALANPDTLKYVPEYNLIMRADAPDDDKVSIIQGSGSGHEPAHVMIVGKGMLDAACPGDVFAAPPMDYVLETSKLLASPKGVAAHRQQLHGRPDGVRHGHARWPRPTASPSRRCSSTTTSPSRTPPAPSAGAAWQATSS